MEKQKSEDEAVSVDVNIAREFADKYEDLSPTLAEYVRGLAGEVARLRKDAKARSKAHTDTVNKLRSELAWYQCATGLIRGTDARTKP